MRPRRTRGLLGLVAVGGLIAAAFLGCGPAKATPLDDYVIVNAPVICSLLDEYPSVAGVEGVVTALVSKGLSGPDAGEVARAVQGWCPRHIPEIQAFAAKWAGAGVQQA
jgi:hypothetical protein